MASMNDRNFGGVSSAMRPPQKNVNTATLSTPNATASIISKQLTTTTAPKTNGMAAKNSGVIDLTDEEESRTERKSMATVGQNSTNGFVSLSVSSAICRLIFFL